MRQLQSHGIVADWPPNVVDLDLAVKAIHPDLSARVGTIGPRSYTLYVEAPDTFTPGDHIFVWRRLDALVSGFVLAVRGPQ